MIISSIEIDKSSVDLSVCTKMPIMMILDNYLIYMWVYGLDNL